MWEKPTGDLGKDLMSADSIDTYLRKNEGYFYEQSITETLAELYERKSISKAALARQSGMSEVYLHQVFSGRRTPSRDRLLCLCIGLGASAEEAQSLLQQAHHAPLYARDKRDAVLLFGLSHSLTLPEINDALFTAGAETLL